jgi:hypothetical protein
MGRALDFSANSASSGVRGKGGLSSAPNASALEIAQPKAQTQAAVARLARKRENDSMMFAFAFYCQKR